MEDIEIKTFTNHILRSYEVKDFSMYMTNYGDLKLNNIIVPKSLQKTGIGSDIMREVGRFADNHGVRVILTTGVKDPHHGTTSGTRLKKFYKRFGFVENKGRNKDFSISENMYRNPKMNESHVKSFKAFNCYNNPKSQ